MRKKYLDSLPESYRRDIELAINILLKSGCNEIYLFGSLVNGKLNEYSDIDIATKGLPKGIFFKTLGKLFLALNHSIDLIDYNKEIKFINLLKDKGELIRVA